MDDHRSHSATDIAELLGSSIDAVPGSSLETISYGHGMTELAASCNGMCCGSCVDWVADE